MATPTAVVEAAAAPARGGVPAGSIEWPEG